ncbi:hypothetical protein N7463_007430 [Penicillium fimorum]|uniref:Uncharacterized protein n=1 Tax=Penicillium fimorum TaxID=1882269 RepID=A0A9W9XXL7_9EURO|nr:hypothetical protein N7463_007430 [Penicillium fimorum]
MVWASDTLDLLDDSLLSLTDYPVDFHTFGTISNGPPPFCLPALSRPISAIHPRSLWPTPKSSIPTPSRECPDITHDSIPHTSSDLQDGSQLIGCWSPPRGDIRQYMGRSFWALASNQIADCDMLLQAQQLRVLAQDGLGRN